MDALRGSVRGRHVEHLCRMSCATVGSEHVSGLSGTACKYARRCAHRLPGRVFCVSDLVSCGPAITPLSDRSLRT
eukprot:1241197-Prymnesium_polylepis.1